MLRKRFEQSRKEWNELHDQVVLRGTVNCSSRKTRRSLQRLYRCFERAYVRGKASNRVGRESQKGTRESGRDLPDGDEQ